jgi:hypothetical protein
MGYPFVFVEIWLRIVEQVAFVSIELCFQSYKHCQPTLAKQTFHDNKTKQHPTS